MAAGTEFLEGGKPFALEVPGLPYALTLPWVWLPGEEQDVRIDDVVTTGGTIQGLVDPLDQVARLKNLPGPIPLRGVFCVAEEGKRTRILPAPVHALARLPDPVLRPGTRKPGPHQGRLWPRP